MVDVEDRQAERQECQEHAGLGDLQEASPEGVTPLRGTISPMAVISAATPADRGGEPDRTDVESRGVALERVQEQLGRMG